MIDCNRSILIARIVKTNYIYIKTSGLLVYYNFELGDKRYDGPCNIGMNYSYELKNELLYKSIPIIYCAENPDINCTLITPEQFNQFGYYFPDSLNWIENFRKK